MLFESFFEQQTRKRHFNGNVPLLWLFVHAEKCEKIFMLQRASPFRSETKNPTNFCMFFLSSSSSKRKQACKQ